MAAFVTILSADVSESDEIISVVDNTGARTTYPWRAVIESEVIYVRSGVAEGLVWIVGRGADDTDPAFHAVGTILMGVAVGQAATSEPLVEDGMIPAGILTDDDQGDILTSDPTVTGV